jgi:hypothetical protein
MISPPYAERLLGIWMQSAFNTIDICKNDVHVRASSVRLYEHVRGLNKTLETGRMSALTVSGGGPVSVTVVVEEERFVSVF